MHLQLLCDPGYCADAELVLSADLLEKLPFDLQSNEFLRSGCRPIQSTHSSQRVGQIKLPNWAISKYRNQRRRGVASTVRGGMTLFIRQRADGARPQGSACFNSKLSHLVD